MDGIFWDSGLYQLTVIHFGEVEASFACLADEFWHPRGEVRRHVVADFVAARADSRSDRRDEIVRDRLVEFGHQENSAGNDSGGCSSPARVYRRHDPASAIGQQDWDAIGCPHGDELTRRGCDQPVGFSGLSVERGDIKASRGVDLAQGGYSGCARIEAGATRAESVLQPPQFFQLLTAEDAELVQAEHFFLGGVRVL